MVAEGEEHDERRRLLNDHSGGDDDGDSGNVSGGSSSDSVAPLSEASRRFHVVRLTATFLSTFFCLGVLQSFLGPTLPDLERQVNSTSTEVALLYTTRSIGYITGSLVTGSQMDRMPATWVLFVSVVGAATCTAAFGLTKNLAQLLATAAMQGLNLGAIEAITSVMLIRLHRGPHVGSYVQLLHAFFGVGSVVGPLLVLAFVSQANSDEVNPLFFWSFLSVAISTTPAALWVMYEAIFPMLPVVERKEWAGDSVEALAGSVPGDQSLLGGRGAVRWIVLVLTSLFLGVYGGGEVAFGSYIYTFATDSGIDTGSSDFAVILTSVFYAAFTLGRMVGVRIVRFVQTSRLVLLNMLVATTAMIAFFLPTLTLAADDNTSGALATLWVGTIVVGFAMGSTYPGGIAIAEEWTDVDGVASAAFIFGGAGGVMLIPLLVGALLEATGTLSFVICIAATMLMTALIQIILQAVLAAMVRRATAKLALPVN